MVVHAYYPHTETRVQRQAEALVGAGFHVDVICLRGDGEEPRETHRGVEIHRLPVRVDKRSLAWQFLSYLHFLVRASFHLTRLQMRERYDSIQVHNLPDFLVFCGLVPKLQGVPVILDLHDLMPEFFSARFGRGSLRRPLGALIRWQERVACRFADHVITVSDHWRRALIQRGVPPERCSVVMNVADDRIFRPIDRASNGSGLDLIYHGTLTERYGLDLAIRAIGIVRREIPDVRLTIMGSGDARPALLALRTGLGLEGHVELSERHVPEVDLPGVIARADLAVVPYRDDLFTDAIVPTKLMEYAAIGMPCIAARTSGIQSYFRDAMVEFFTPGDVEDLARCILLLGRDPARREALARGSHRFTDRYNWGRLGKAYVDLVRTMSIARAGAPR